MSANPYSENQKPICADCAYKVPHEDTTDPDYWKCSANGRRDSITGSLQGRCQEFNLEGLCTKFRPASDPPLQEGRTPGVILAFVLGAVSTAWFVVLCLTEVTP